MRKHLENIYTRLEVSNRAAAVARASGNCARVGVERFDADCLIGVVPCAYGRASRATRGCWPRRCPRARCRCWSSSSPQPGHAGVCARRLTCPFRVRPGQPTALGRYPRQGRAQTRGRTRRSASLGLARRPWCRQDCRARPDSQASGAGHGGPTKTSAPQRDAPPKSSPAGRFVLAFTPLPSRQTPLGIGRIFYYSAVVAQTVKV